MYGMLYNPIHRLHRQNFSYLVRNNFLYIFYRSALFSEDSNNVLVTTIDDK